MRVVVTTSDSPSQRPIEKPSRERGASAGARSAIHVNDSLAVVKLGAQHDRVTAVDELERVRIEHDSRHAFRLATRREIIEQVERRARGDCSRHVRQVA